MGLGTASKHRQPRITTERKNRMDKINICCEDMPFMLYLSSDSNIMFNSTPYLRIHKQAGIAEIALIE